ncbi:MAG: ATP-grasp domain-containing protein [Candidatus Omnitrophica bacterium]|nr:ATP-grasp domain-containing protein [Candidatus Omnitrophota bacterium]
MNIAIAYNLKKEDDSKPPDYFSEFDSQETIDAIDHALKIKGHTVSFVDAERSDLFGYFKKNRIDMVFNIAEGTRGKFREAQLPAILDYLNIPYTGSGTLSLAVALNKTLTKKILRAEKIPTPNSQLFLTGKEKLDPALKFPLIIKPNCEGSAKGISVTNVVHSHKELSERLEVVIKTYEQDALVEEFIEGKELTVGILENGKTTVLPILEIDFSSCSKSGEYFYSWRMKEFQGNDSLGLTPTFHCPARLDKATEKLIQDTALKTHRAIGCYDISRTDIRLNNENIPYVLEINPLPGLNPRTSNFPIMAYAAGLKYEDIIDSVLMNAHKRRRA